MKGAAVNYNEDLGAQLEEDFVGNLTTDDVTGGNIGYYMSQMFANNSPSILATVPMLASGGIGGLLVGSGTRIAGAKVAQAGLSKAAGKLAQASFFTMGYGGKLSDMEIANKNAQGQIDGLNKELESGDLTAYERIEKEKQIDNLNQVLSIPQWKRSTNAFWSGSVELLTERLGSLSYITNLNKFSTVAGTKPFKKLMYGGMNTLYNVGIELGEETTAQIAGNLGDIVLLDEDKSIVDGIDKDFLANTVFTSMTIQGPGMGGNMYNMFKDEMATRSERKTTNKRRTEFYELTLDLQDRASLTKKQQKEKVARQKEILEAEAFDDVKATNKLNRLSKEEQLALFDLNRQRRKKLRDLRSEGAKGDTKTAQQRKNQLVSEYKKIDDQRDNLLNKNKRKNQKKAKDNVDPAQYEFNIGMNEFYTDLVEMNQVKNKSGFEKFEEGNPPNIEALTEKYGRKTASQIMNSYKKGSNAANVGNDIFLFQENIDLNMANTIQKTESEIAAVAPMHELLHIQNRKAGLVKDDVVVSQANRAIKELDGELDVALAGGRVTQEQFDNFQARKKIYTTSKGVNVEELLNLYGDFVSIGVLSPSSLNNMFGIKNTLSTLVNKFNPTNQAWLFPMKTGKDVYGYLDSFQKSAKEMDVAIDEDDKPSKLVEQKSNLAALTQDFDMATPKGRRAFLNEKLVKDAEGNFVSDLNQSEFGKEIGGIIESTTKRLYDKVPSDLKRGISRQDFKNDLITLASTLTQQEFDPSKQDLDKFISNRLNLRANKLATDTFGQEFQDDITEAKDVAIDESDDRPAEKEVRKSKLKDRLVTNEDQKKNLDRALEKIRNQVNSLPIGSLNFKTLKDLATREVQKMFGIDPKPGNLTKKDVNNAQAFINKNADALIAMLPQGATPSGTSTGVQQVLLNEFYRKGDRASMAKTGTKAGLAVQTKRNDITPSEFKEVFGIRPAGESNVSDRNTSARVKALVSQTERMLTNQEVRQALSKEGRDIPSILAEGKSEVMESKSINELSPEQIELYDKISNARGINDVAKILNLDPVTVNDENREEKQLAILQAIRDHGLSVNVFKSAMPASSGAVRFAVKKKKTEKQLDGYIAKNNIKAKEGDYYYKLTNGEYVLGQRVLDKDGKQAFDKKGKKRFLPPVDKDGVPLTNLVAKKGRLYYGVTDPAYITALESAERNPDSQKPKRITVKGRITKEFYDSNKEQSDMNMDILEDVATQLGKAVADGMNPSLAALLIAQGYQASAGLIKISAPFTTVSKIFEHGLTPKQRTGVKYREEHNPPASVIGATLIAAIVNNEVAEVFPFIRKNYSQTQLSKLDDEKIDQARLDATLPEGFSIFNNPAIRLAKSGINLNSLVNIRTGITVAEQIGIGVSEEFANIPDVIALQNEQLDLIEKGKSIEEANADIQAFLPISKTMKEASDVTVAQLNESKVLNVNDNMTTQDLLNKAATIDAALALANKGNKKIKKIRVFDFDDTIAKSNSLVYYTKPNGTQGELTAEQFASKGAELVNEGAVMDFSDFNVVRNGERGPLFEVAQAIKESRGNEDLFILTARAPEAQQAIYQFLKDEGLEFKMDNIVTLGNSTGEAKANWMIDKAAEGYNDFYFADDAYQNVKAVQDAMSVIDVKSEVQQALINESVSLNDNFNKIIEQKTGIASEKRYSEAKAKVRGEKRKKFQFFIPYSAEDFMGLIYPLLSKGKLGDSQLAWFKKNLIDKFAKAQLNLQQARVTLMEDFKKLKQDLNVPKDLSKESADGFTNEQAVRVYLWNKLGLTIPGLSATDTKELVASIENNPTLKTFADKLAQINKDPYPAPLKDWLTGTITTDLMRGLKETKRPEYLKEWQENVDVIFSPENLNKLEAAYGPRYRESLENILARMKSGSNRIQEGNRLSNRILNYINGSNAAIMFFNTRSAILQTISSINFMNWSFNNPVKAGAAFANQGQYWKDFMTLMNSDFLKDRRNGLKINITESEIADAAKTSKNKAKAVLNYILSKGYAPTQYADSFAIASGGATYYRNRINDLVKNEGMPIVEAQEQAMQEFMELTEENQQSSRPDKISQQQSSDYGRLILMFANTPMQYARLQKRAFQDLVNGRGDSKTNVSKIIYYGVVQNIIFNALQQAVFALGFGDEEEDDKQKSKRAIGVANGMADSLLRGLGIGGATVSVVKNFLLDIYERSGRKRPEYVDSIYKLLQFSPPISSKISRLRAAAWSFDSKKRRQEMLDKGFSLDNPAYMAGAKVVSATSNVPLDRVLLKLDNLSGAMDENNDLWQRIALASGWPEWQLKPPTIYDTAKTKSSKRKVKIRKRKVKKRKIK